MKLFSRNKATIGSHSNNNTIMENCTLNNPTLMLNNNLNTLGMLKHYDAIQEIIKSELAAASSLHPLFPEFSAKFDSHLNQLVSNPETETALKKYPKRIQGKFTIDLQKYPNFNKSEDPFDYAYRTQTTLELPTEEISEYLGDIKDPYPILDNPSNSPIISVIKPPEFPEAIKVHIISGNIKIPFMFRRIPCSEYGKTKFGNVSSENSFDFWVELNDTTSEISISFAKTSVDSLHTLLLREKLFNNIYITKQLVVNADEQQLLQATVDTEVSGSSIAFYNNKSFIDYIENLITIEEFTGCHFNPDIQDVSYDDFYTAAIMVSSFRKHWLLRKMTFDNDIRCCYNHIDTTLLEHKHTNTIFIHINNYSFSLHGLNFVAKECFAKYTDAEINNINSIQKNIKRKKKDILITIKPTSGKDTFNKYIFYNDISLEPNSHIQNNT